jgi:hypothetical protein
VEIVHRCKIPLYFGFTFPLPDREGEICVTLLAPDNVSSAQMDTSPRASSLALVSMQFHHIVETGRAQEVWSTEYGVHVPIWAANSEKWNTGWL